MKVLVGLVFSRSAKGFHFREIADRHFARLNGIFVNTMYWGQQQCGSECVNQIFAQSEVVLIGWNQIRGVIVLAASVEALAILLLFTEMYIFEEPLC